MRHAAAMWQMQAGTDPWKAAGWLAMSLEVLLETYGHHHPDFQDEAASAYGRTCVSYFVAQIVATPKACAG